MVEIEERNRIIEALADELELRSGGPTMSFSVTRRSRSDEDVLRLIEQARRVILAPVLSAHSDTIRNTPLSDVEEEEEEEEESDGGPGVGSATLLGHQIGNDLTNSPPGTKRKLSSRAG